MTGLELTPELKEILIKSGSRSKSEAATAADLFAQALTVPLRAGIMAGNILDGIFETEMLDRGISAEYPLDFLAPGTEKDFVAYTMPNHGYIPQRHVEGDYVQVPMYKTASSIDTTLQYLEDARWAVVSRMLAVLEATFVKKLNDDGFHTLLQGAVDRNILVFDSDAAAGQFTKRIVSLLKTVMRRNGGGNSSSINRGRMTDAWLSPEGMEDIRNWGVDIVDEVTRREIFIAEDTLSRIFGVILHDIDELGEGQEYQDYYTVDLAASLASTDVELMICLDLANRDSFYMPMRQPVQVFADDNMHREGRMGWYATSRSGFALLDGRRVLAASF